MGPVAHDTARAPPPSLRACPSVRHHLGEAQGRNGGFGWEKVGALGRSPDHHAYEGNVTISERAARNTASASVYHAGTSEPHVNARTIEDTMAGIRSCSCER